MKRRIRCSCVNTDGTQCGRTVTDGSQPPVCHIHRAAASGSPHNNASGMNQPLDRTPEEILRRLLRDSDPNVRLRALDLWQKRFEDREKAPNNSYHDLLHAATDDERKEFWHLVDRLNEVKDTIYQRHPGLEVDAITEGWRRRREQERLAAQPTEQAPATPAPPIATAPEIEAPATPDETQVRPLPQSAWAQVGLFSLNGIVTHALGDEHTQRVLTGEIPFEEARARQLRVQRHTASLALQMENDHE